MTIVMVLSLFGGVAPRVYAAQDVPAAQAKEQSQVLPDYSKASAVIPETDTDDLFAGYVDQVFSSYSPKKSEPSRGTVHTDLEGEVNLAIYKALKAQIEKVAAGEITSTAFSFSASSVGIDSSVFYTEEDLGLTSFWDEDGNFSYEAQMALQEKVGIDLFRIISALTNNCPYDLYWFDKTMGCYPDFYAISDYGVGFSETMMVYFLVSGEYQGGDEITVDPSAGRAVQHAAAKAASIVEANASLSDYDKLAAYKQAICDLTSYNYTAIDENWNYGNAWQLIWVFDEDENTNVVCEGYSKAFQYLCQLSAFSSSLIESRIVIGDMVVEGSGEAHMWNIVSMDDGRNYLVDITNCDDYSIGYPDLLFLKAASGSVTGGYTINCYGYDVGYYYDIYTRDLYSTAVLTLSGTDYVPGQETPVDKFATLYQAFLTLSGKLSINFRLRTDYEGIVAKLYYENYSDYGLVKEVPLNNANFHSDENGAYYLVTYDQIPAKEMTMNLRIKVYDAEGNPIKLFTGKTYKDYYDYSVSKWCNNKINQNNDADDVMIAKALLNYGHYSQIALGFYDGVDERPERLANPNGYLADEMVSFAGANEAYDSVTKGGKALGAKSFLLQLKSDTNIRLTMGRQVNVAVDGVECIPEFGKDEQGNDAWFAYYYSIPAKNLHEHHLFTLTEGDDSATLKYAALSWANSKLKGTNENDKNLAKALYLYNYAARHYFHYDEAGL